MATIVLEQKGNNHLNQSKKAVFREITTKNALLVQYFSQQGFYRPFCQWFWEERGKLKGKNRFWLTVKERVLVHLLDHYQPVETGRVSKAPITVSQEGIADAAGIYLTHASRAAKELEKKGLVDGKLGYVEGVSRKRKVYFLTPAGVSKAREIKTHLEQKKILVRGLDGKVNRVKLSEVNNFLEKEIGIKYPTLRIIGSLSGDALDCKTILEEEKEYADFMRGLAQLRHFFEGARGMDEIKKAYLAVGEIYVSTGRRDKAIEFFKRSLDMFTQLGVEKSVKKIRQLRQTYPNNHGHSDCLKILTNREELSDLHRISQE